MSAPILPVPTPNLSVLMQGVWWLLSREDYTKDGQRTIDPIMGADPTGILAYAKHHFSAQFMKRDRNDDSVNPISHSGHNNTSAVGGYDAYFGNYEADEATGRVKHTLIGSIIPKNVGVTVYRDIRVNGDQLVIQLETTTPTGEPITRTLTWKRVS